MQLFALTSVASPPGDNSANQVFLRSFLEVEEPLCFTKWIRCFFNMSIKCQTTYQCLNLILFENVDEMRCKYQQRKLPLFTIIAKQRSTFLRFNIFNDMIGIQFSKEQLGNFLYDMAFEENSSYSKKGALCSFLF